MAPSRGCALFTSSIVHLRSSATTHVPPVRLPTSRTWTSTPVCASGHNRWSKIKHDKAKVDSAKNSQRSQFAKELTLASKLFGPDPALNPRLADLITKAKREGFAKASIEAAIARGQGRSMHGAALESVLVEGILPGNVACMVECETDHRLRTLQEVRLVLKNAGGVASPISYLFKKVGRVVFEGKEGVGSDEALEPALEAGATDVWEVASSTGDNAPRIAVSAEPAETKAVADQVSKVLDLAIATSDIVWEPEQQTIVTLESERAALDLIAVIDELLDKETSVQAIAMNVAQGAVSGETWDELQSRLCS